MDLSSWLQYDMKAHEVNLKRNIMLRKLMQENNRTKDYMAGYSRKKNDNPMLKNQTNYHPGQLSNFISLFTNCFVTFFNYVYRNGLLSY